MSPVFDFPLHQFATPAPAVVASVTMLQATCRLTWARWRYMRKMGWL